MTRFIIGRSLGSGDNHDPARTGALKNVSLENRPMRDSPFYVEGTQDEAIVFKHCGRDLVAALATPLS